MYRKYQGLWWAISFMAIVLIAWTALGLYLLIETAACNVATGPEEPILHGVLPCVTPNEMGDILAGFFAPAAFFVLTGAVFLQSLELKAQRDELAETRTVFLEQNKLIETQTRAAQASANLFEVQNSILKLQEERMAAKALDEECNEALEQLAHHLRNELDGTNWQAGKAHGNYMGFRVNFTGEEETIAFLRGFYNLVSADHVGRGLSPPYLVGTTFEPAVRRAHVLATRVLTLSAMCGIDRQALVETMRVKELADLFADRINNLFAEQLSRRGDQSENSKSG
ncbi:hypothetical protein B0E45_17760 [Sinorhizobium sp. A49]|uniref:hypothetical protein n=1 Tax=Sinorhizobium sp. A49 TaxID=1945861 RepID=UPI0009848597|nr:hypothetical protein [Sinorhizobium sp. A49]OOG68691.1 hypothetical protein B0E45_17760 [Sinorhizobium sp. A49]